MKRAIVLILDGLRRDMLTADLTPNLARHSGKSEQFSAHRSVFPSATRVVSASFATGCYPARHELQGNSLVLSENGVLVSHDAGHPDFLQHKRRVTGRSLAAPTMAERLAPNGGAVIYAHASPGAAYAHDPDGFGTVYHRAGSFGPGRKPVDGWNASTVKLGIEGDRVMAERFVADAVLGPRRPPLSVLWCGEPDYTSHAAPLGSPPQLEVLREADGIAGDVFDAVAEARASGDEILLVVGSDHGHQTVRAVVDVESELVAAGLKSAPGSADVISVSNGTSILVYVDPASNARIAEVGAFLQSRSWAGEVIPAAALAAIGQTSRHGLAFAVSMAADERPNAFGIPGTSYEAKPAEGKNSHLGCGQHGGLARFEQSPFLLIQGAGFAPGASRTEPTSVVDIAPTIMRHLGIEASDMDGRPLQR